MPYKGINIDSFFSKKRTEPLWYDRLGRICLSQNALQRNLLYSYTQYDAYGRIIEVGQVSTVPQSLPSCFHCVGCTIAYGVLPVLPDTFTHKDAELQNFINTGTKTQVTHTYYDSVTYSNVPLTQQYLRKRIASITYEENNDNNIKTYDNAIHYSYDIEGNVSSILIDVPHDSIVKQRYKRINYYYDLVSRNINEMVYEQDSIDQFIHNYSYDADNRLEEVNTSHDSLFWEQDAEYEYYDHGPLAREVIGRRQVQGLDYAYTLNGWLKGVNSSINNPSYDMGHDGNVHDANNTVARDAYGFTLNYYNGDYRSIAASSFQASALPITSLYNGNIAGATYSIQPLTPKTVGYTYSYDQLNRYVGDSVFKGLDTVNNTWATRTGINDLKEKVSYDENGNILVYLRHGNTMNGGPLAMDSLTYHYTKGRNQLAQVNDAVGATNYTVDIDNETSKYNYKYNGIGELAKDSAGGLDTIIWNVYGKVKEIRKHNGDSIVLFYDPVGNRLEKRFYPHSATADTTMYGRDGTGKILAVYDRKKDTVRLTEWDMYGSMRLGSLDTIMRMTKPVIGAGSIDSITYYCLEGQKQYELDNHLGNVLVTISDKKIPVDTISTDTLAKYYVPLVISSQDYYTFGMVEPGRSYLLNSDSSYTFGWQGKLKTNEIYGANNSLDFGARMYDPRLGRMMSPDPDNAVYPCLSPYNGMGDDPIEGTDIDGRLIIFINGFWPGNGDNSMLQLESYWDVQLKANAAATFGDYEALYFNASTFFPLGLESSGEAKGAEYAIYIKHKLDEQRENGDPTAVLNFLSHSEGGPYAVGMITALSEAKYPDDYPDPNLRGQPIFKASDFGTSIFLAPFSGFVSIDGGLVAPLATKNIQISHSDDYVAHDAKMGGNVDYTSTSLNLPSTMSNPFSDYMYRHIAPHMNSTFSIQIGKKSQDNKQPTNGSTTDPQPKKKDTPQFY